MKAVEAFLKIKEFWLDTAVKYADQLKNKELPREQKIDALKKMLMASRDLPIDGVVFPCDKVIIEGNDKFCVKGTILDVSSPGSLIYPYYKIFIICARLLLVYYHSGDLPKLRYLWDRYVKKDVELTEENILSELLGSVEYCFGKDGYFDKLISRAEKGEWKIGV
jgi:hypothetical protein